MKSKIVPRAVYRLQLTPRFTFDDARHIVPYLDALGISHVYVSPCLKPSAGSLHGYDIVDHGSLNPELGGRKGFARFVDALHARGMGLILDIVPDHMGIGSGENAWWTDVLENGQASPYAGYFDIDWHPIRESLRGKVVLPVLGDHYGKVLEAGELVLEFNARRGEFFVRYYDRNFPLDPESYPALLTHEIERLHELANEEGHTLIEWHELITNFEKLGTVRNAPEERARSSSACKQRLAALHAQSPAVQAFLDQKLRLFNGKTAEPESFDGLHRVLERQSFRLAYWRVASDEINYRRFFDINELVCLRQENPDVFEATHRLILALIVEGSVDGLRIDHVDGLWDPCAYCARLQSQVRRLTGRADGGGQNGDGQAIYLLVEKILARYERLREDWPVAGTTGYEFANLVNGLFVYGPAEEEFTRLYARFVGRNPAFDEVLYERKHQVIRTQMSSGLNTLENLLGAIAQSERVTRDYTLNGLREALAEIVAFFPVYRTYIVASEVCEEDRRFIEWAIAQAKKHSPASDVTIYDFIRDVLLLTGLEGKKPESRSLVLYFVMKFQQYTGPVMAKSLEDTSFYVYNRLVSLNEVGGDPSHFGTSVAAFHHANLHRLSHWPHSLITLATHDSKRSGDVRARINVLSEVVSEWWQKISRWRRLNRGKKTLLDGQPAPSRNAEYLLYQTLIGTWPLDKLDDAGLVRFRERIESYMLKAVKEAKIHTSWINPNADYERAVVDFVGGLLHPSKSRRFLDDFLPFQQRIARFAFYNSVSQTLLLLTAPGVPDIYQGTELWRHALVDPDNRGPVDFTTREDVLADIGRKTQCLSHPKLLRELLDHIEDGRAKLFVIWQTLSLRRKHPELFERGDYLSLDAFGEKAEHVCVFARRLDGKIVIAAAARWFARLPDETGARFCGSDVWKDTRVQIPDCIDRDSFIDLFSDTVVKPLEIEGARWLMIGDVLEYFPVALLSSMPD